jgi:bacterioferritin
VDAVARCSHGSCAEETARMTKAAFVADIEEIRRRARVRLEDGARTPGYTLDATTAIGLLNDAVATELICVLRYKFHAIMAQGINSESVKKEFEEHAAEEQEHMEMLAERINQLGGKPDLNPANVTKRAASEYVEGDDLVDMIKENLVAERIAIDTYRLLISFFGEEDPTTRIMLEKILAQEEEHANDMHDLLVAHEGKPMLRN